MYPRSFFITDIDVIHLNISCIFNSLFFSIIVCLLESSLSRLRVSAME